MVPDRQTDLVDLAEIFGPPVRNWSDSVCGTDLQSGFFGPLRGTNFRPVFFGPVRRADFPDHGLDQDIWSGKSVSISIGTAVSILTGPDNPD